MRVILFVLSIVLTFSCKPATPEETFVVQNVLLPLEPPLTPRTMQSRAIRKLGPPFDEPLALRSIYLSKAEIGNPDFPDLAFAKEIRLFLVDPEGKMILAASSGKIPAKIASITLIPTGNQDLAPLFQHKKLDMVLEADNTLTSGQGVMLIGNFEFSYRVK